MRSFNVCKNSFIRKPVTINLTNKLSLRIYGDTQPNFLEIAPLHKGLALVYNNEELIEEGIGFGVPVVKYKDKTYFSSTACISFEDLTAGVIKKSFVLDTVSRKRFRKATYLNDDLYSFLRLFFEKPYLTAKFSKSFFNRIMEIRNKLGIKTDFAKVQPRGMVSVIYRCQSMSVNVSVDFSNLNLDNCKEILVLNEQGANFFNEYLDASGLRLKDDKIGAWASVSPGEASLFNSGCGFGFSLRTIKDAELFRGWEKTRDRFCWAGLSYSFLPERRIFDYQIGLRF